MIINKAHIEEINKNSTLISFKLDKSPFEHSSLEYTIEAQFQHLLCDSLDCALIALLIPSMTMSEPIVLAGSVSRRLFTCLPTIQVLLKDVYPELNIIPITCDRLVYEQQQNDKSVIATGFSAGVDSFATITDIKPENIGYFLFNNVGSHGLAGEELFNKRFSTLKPGAKELNIPFVKVNSNLDLFYDNNLTNFIYNHSLRNISVALLLQNGINQYYYASTYHLRDFDINKRPDISHLDPILLPMFSTEKITVLPHGTTMIRFDKTSLITQQVESYEYLDVCVDEEHATNCSNCMKCHRTMATLDIIGKLHLYNKVFDLPFYYKNKFHIFYRLGINPSLFAKEVITLSKQHNFTIPIFSQFLSKVKLPYRVNEWLKGPHL